MLSIVKSLIKVDRDGDFFLHIKAVSEVLRIFASLDGSNYLRCATVYYETRKGAF